MVPVEPIIPRYVCVMLSKSCLVSRLCTDSCCAALIFKSWLADIVEVPFDTLSIRYSGDRGAATLLLWNRNDVARIGDGGNLEGSLSIESTDLSNFNCVLEDICLLLGLFRGVAATGAAAAFTVFFFS